MLPYERKEEMSDGNREGTTVSVQMEEIKRAILALPFVTKLSPVRAHKSHGAGWGATLKCASCPGCCGKKPAWWEKMQVDDLSQIHPVILFSIAVMTVAALHYIIRYPHFLSRCRSSHKHSFCQKKNAILMHLRESCSPG